MVLALSDVVLANGDFVLWREECDAQTSWSKRRKKASGHGEEKSVVHIVNSVVAFRRLILDYTAVGNVSVALVQSRK